jgi:hypothetical protein
MNSNGGHLDVRNSACPKGGEWNNDAGAIEAMAAAVPVLACFDTLI